MLYILVSHQIQRICVTPIIKQNAQCQVINYEFKTELLTQLGCVLESPYPILLVYDVLYEWFNPYNLTMN